MVAVLVLILLAGLSVAERSGGLVSNLVDGGGEEPEPDGSPGSPQSEPQEPERKAEPDNEQDSEPAADGSAEPPEGGDERRAESGGPGCQAPPVPSQPDDAVVLAEGCTEVMVRPGEERVVDGNAIVREEGSQAPACAAFGSYYSWQVTDDPPSGVEFTAVRQGARYHLGEGSEGDVSGMCGTVSVRNPGSSPTALHLRYLLLDCQPTGQAC